MKVPERGLPRAEWHFQRIQEKLKDPEVRKRFGKLAREVREENERAYRTNIGWKTERNIYEYGDYFDPILKRMRLGKGIAPALESIPRGGGPLEIHEHGAGDGKALSELKLDLEGRGIPVSVTAVDSFPHPALESRKKERSINRVEMIDSANFRPDNEAGAIFDVLGSTNYMLPELRKDHLLMRAHQLAPGGILMVLVASGPGGRSESPVESKRMTGRISGTGEDGYVFGRRKDLVEDVDSVVRAFKKQGFDADYDQVSGQIFLVVHKPTGRGARKS